MNGGYVPDRGDVIWVDFDPQVGREQSERRPALVLSPKDYNAKTGLAVMCPITSRRKNLPFEVLIPAGLAVAGVVLTDHIKNQDWLARQATYQCRMSALIVDEVLTKIDRLIK